MNLQITLENKFVKLIPLQDNDFEEIFTIASDPLIWKQYQNKNRSNKEIFNAFFQDAIKSRGVYKVIDLYSDEVAGCTGFYGYDTAENSIFIGYTFYARKFWGSKLNPKVKQFMLDYIFQFVDKVYMDVSQYNIRSQKAIEKLGAQKVEVTHHYYESNQEKVLYEIIKSENNLYR